MIEMFNKIEEGSNYSFIVEFKEFIRKHSVQSISGELKVKITILKKKLGAEKTIIFVHGWKGDKDSFGKMPEILSKQLNCKTMIYQYPTNVWIGSPSLDFISKNLEVWIKNRIAEPRLAFITHSMGGIIVRKMLITQEHRKEPLDKYVGQITLIASPHNGAVLAGIAKYVPVIAKIQIRELDPNSPFLVDLNERWDYWKNTHVPEKCHVRCIYGTKDDIVSINNARALDPEAIPILNAGHIDIVKAISAEDEIVLTISRLLKESPFMRRK